MKFHTDTAVDGSTLRAERLTDSDLHELISDADSLDVSPEELDAFDDSSFDAADIVVPLEMQDPQFLLNMMERNQLHATKVPALAETDALLFAHCIEVRTSTALGEMTAERFTQLIPLVIRAYADVRTGWSADYTVIDPELNLMFLQRCWQLGAAASPEELNWTLINSRKCGKLQGMPRSKRFSIDHERMDRCSFASEIALRHLQDRAFFEEQRFLSLDKLLCSPQLAKQFDELARQLVPGLNEVDYRWAALTLRKARRTAMSSLMTDLPGIALADVGTTDDVRPSRLQPCAGLFWFRIDDDSTYVGVARDLRQQVDRVLQAAGPGIIPQWMNAKTQSRARLYLAEMPQSRENDRERFRSALLKKHGARLNFFTHDCLSGAA